MTARDGAPSPFADCFSGQASTYAEARPDYPAALFDYVAGLVDRRDLAWDCGTGSGQAAVALATRFGRVIATDASAAQIAHARPAPGVEYRVAPADASGIAPSTVDVVTVAQALHWFDLDRFYAEVRRVLRPDGALAAWSYGDPTIVDDPALDACLHRFNTGTLGPYWPTNRRAVGEGYRRLPFPFAERPAPAMVIERHWSLHELAQYLRSWSARARYLSIHGTDPVTPFELELARSWHDPAERHLVRWPLTIRAGHLNG